MSRRTPWTVRQDDGQAWEVVDAMGLSVASGGGPDNARLIAAAPELLEALKRCEELLISITDIRSDLAECQHGYIRQARAAIAKAEGKPDRNESPGPALLAKRFRF